MSKQQDDRIYVVVLNPGTEQGSASTATNTDCTHRPGREKAGTSLDAATAGCSA